MSPTATSAGAAPLLEALYKSGDSKAAAAAAEQLTSYINTQGLRTLDSENILDSLIKATRNKKNEPEREAAAIAIGAIATKVGGKNAPTPLGAEPWLLPVLPILLELYSEKNDAIKKAAEGAVAALFVLPPAEAVPEVLATLYDILESPAAKWQSKVGALKLIGRMADSASEQIGEQLVDLIPHLKHCMTDTKSEVAKQAVKTTTKVCGVIDNNDIRPHLGSLVEAMRAPDTVPECIKRLSSTTFVAEVTGPALAVMVPLLARALGDRSSTVQRSTSIIVENLTKLVRDPHEAVRFLPALTPGVERIATGAAFPEVRQHASSALKTIQAATKAVGDAEPEEDPKKVFLVNRAAALERITKQLKDKVPSAYADVKADSWAQTGLLYTAALIARLADKRIVHASAWDDVYVLPYLRRVASSAEEAKAATDALRAEYVELDKQRFGAPEEDDEEIEGECLVRIQFSLAYGGLLLLNHTMLRLHRGHRYGIVASNGSGKSTLLKAMRDGKVENFPTEADGVRTVMVEHNQGDGAGVRIVDYVHSDEKVQLQGKTIDDAHAALKAVGFDDERRVAPVESLSGGWKMKLALARAMLTGADILLLDEPTNHLDKASVKWLEEYLTSNKDITVLTVSHDSGFLDNVCTDIMHYENKKIKYYKGNLHDFVQKKPEAKSHYSLASTSVAFSFPPPGSLVGVRSNTRTILKVSDASFTYPGAPKPSLQNASVAISLSTRLGVLGPNGAGKSTLIKLMTQENLPTSGSVTTHPSLRVSTLAQHAFHHIEHHLDKTAVDYMMWRFEGGMDKELIELATRRISAEEAEQLAQPIVSASGVSRTIEMIVGRQKQRRTFNYEIKWRGHSHRDNTWIGRERLIELGFAKLVQRFDDAVAAREGAGSKEISSAAMRKCLEAVGLNGEIAQHNELSGLSGGQKVKVVLAAAMFTNPQVLILDEPTNFLDRDSVAGLALAIQNWSGACIVISHAQYFVDAVCDTLITVEGGRIVSRTKNGVTVDVKDEGEDDEASTPGGGTPAGSGTPAANGSQTPIRGSSRAASRLNSKAGTPTSSAAATPAGSGDEGEANNALGFKAKKKKKMTRNDKKAQDERRRLRLQNWLAYGGVREPDTDDDDEDGNARKDKIGDRALVAGKK